MNYCILDVESGGTDPKVHSLLEVAFIVLDENFQERMRYQSGVGPVNGNYVVTPGALRVNNINLVTHQLACAEPKRVAREIEAGLKIYRDCSMQPLMLVGWNVNFDLRFVTEQLLGQELADWLFGFRTLDLHALSLGLQIKGEEVYGGSLGKTALKLNLAGFETQAHRAMADVELTVAVFKRLVGIGGNDA